MTRADIKLKEFLSNSHKKFMHVIMIVVVVIISITMLYNISGHPRLQSSHFHTVLMSEGSKWAENKEVIAKQAIKEESN